jgi:hypothetical protein
MAWVRAQLCNLQKGCARLAAASDKVYQLLAHGRWFSPGTPASSTTKTGRHDIAEILLKVALNTKIKSNQKELPKCLKINEATVVLNVFKGVTSDVSAYTVTVSLYCSAGIRYQKSYIFVSDRI